MILPTGFDPLSAISGGALIGMAASVLYLGAGRVAGISGIVQGAVSSGEGRGWRVAFVLALMGGAGAWLWLSPSRGAPLAAVGWPWLLVAGVLVGAGTRMGNGCTSGHGICGLSRWSRRSLAAVATFMAVAMLTVYVLRHVLRAT